MPDQQRIPGPQNAVSGAAPSAKAFGAQSGFVAVSGNSGRGDYIQAVRSIVRAHAPRCSTCGDFHNVDTATTDWRSGALGFRHVDGWLLHGKPCTYGGSITARYGTNAELHRVVMADDDTPEAA